MTYRVILSWPPQADLDVGKLPRFPAGIRRPVRSSCLMSALATLLVFGFLIGASPVEGRDTIHFSFHYLAFDEESQDGYGHLLIIDNEATGQSNILASNDVSVFGVQVSRMSMRRLMATWTRNPDGHYNGCWEALKSTIKVKLAEGNEVDLAEALTSDRGSADWLILFNSLLEHARSPIAERSIRDRDVDIVFSYQPAFSYTGHAMKESLQSRLKSFNQPSNSTWAELAIRAVRFGSWPVKIGIMLFVYSLLLVANALIWRLRRRRVVRTYDDYDDGDDGPFRNESEQVVRTYDDYDDGGDDGPPRNEGEQKDLGEVADAEEDLSRYQRFMKRRAEKRTHMNQLRELLNRTVRALNEQHRLAASYYLMVRTVAERLGNDPVREDETNPAAFSKLLKIKDELDKMGKAPLSPNYDKIEIEPIPAPPREGCGSKPVVDGEGPCISPRDSSEAAFFRGIPDKSVKQLIKEVYGPMHNAIWMGQYLKAGREDLLELLGRTNPQDARQTVGGKDGESTVSKEGVPRLSHLWNERPLEICPDDMTPDALWNAYKSYQDLLAREMRSSKSRDKLGAMALGFQWFAGSGWPPDVFKGIPYEEFDSISNQTQEALRDVLWKTGIGIGCAGLARDLRVANIEDTLRGLSLEPAIRDALAETCRYAFDGPRIADNLNSLLRGFIRSCIEASKIGLDLVGKEGLKEKVSRRLAKELASNSIPFLTPLLKGQVMVELVWRLSLIKFPSKKGAIACALHPFRMAVARANEKLGVLLEFARFIPDEIKLYKPGSNKCQVEEFENGGRSVFLRTLWTRFGEEAFREVYLAKGMYNNDYEHVVDIREWGASREGKNIKECGSVVYVFRNNPINLGRKRKKPLAEQQATTTTRSQVKPEGGSQPEACPSESDHEEPRTVSGALQPNETVIDRQTSPPSRDAGFEPSPPVTENSSSREGEKPTKSRPRDDERESKGDEFYDPSK